MSLPLEIKCVDCGTWEPMPEDYKELSPDELCYIEDDYTCEKCWNIREGEKYFRSGMAEMVGSGY